MGFRPRLVAEDAEDQMHPLLPQGIEVAGLLDGLPRIDALFRLQLPPRQAKVAQGHSRLVRACIQHTGRIADLRIGESRFVRLVHRRVLPPGPEQTPRQQQTGCGRRGPALSHGTRPIVLNHGHVLHALNAAQPVGDLTGVVPAADLHGQLGALGPEGLRFDGELVSAPAPGRSSPGFSP